MSQNSSQSRVIIGSIIVIAGVMLLLRNLNVFPQFYYFNSIFSWKMLLVIIGLILFFNSSNKTPGIVLMAVGGFLLIPNILGMPYFNMWRLGLPLLLMAAGILILTRKSSGPKKFSTDTDTGNYDMNYLDEVAIFGGNKKRISSKEFKGGKITVVFGGSELNLHNSNLAEGQNTLDILALFGGTTMYVPEDWSVNIDVVTIFGGFTDSRPQSRLIVQDQKKELLIKGTVLFGGGEIKTPL
jgi:predicted membrane protein